ncbi:MAG: dihydrofolate reductase [Planctomycetota bacterium]
MRISLIVATDLDGVIGRDGTLPWRLPADLAYFKRTTMGCPIIMGRKTYESIGRPLPGRQNVVLTRDASFVADGCDVVTDLDAALAAVGEVDEVFVIGGAQIYAAFLDRADRLHHTVVHTRVAGDTRFDFDESAWPVASREDHSSDAKNSFDYSFLVRERATS